MEIDIHDDKKYVAVWLTKAERDSEQMRESLKPLYETWNRKKYRVVVFLSGNKNLATETKALLAHSLELKR